LENLTNIFNFTTDFLSQFEIGLIESTLIKNTDDTLFKMKKLKNMGFKLSIDNFGTGCAPLLYLKDFPIDCIKIGKVFVDNILQEEKTQKIIESIIYLAKKLDLKIVAKGVEDVNQVKWLYEAGCDEIQGYYYSKPLEINKLVRFIKAINQPESKERYIVWTKKYSIGHYAFDIHHMIIANILNKLYKELKNNNLKQNNEVEIYFELLEMYIDIHFKAEELYMREMSYANIQTHIKKHQEFIDIFNAFKINLSTSNTKNTYDLFKILKEWFIKHELNADKLFMKHK
ncbi:MAG: EAL domain-containing protein, partial [Epsilonproteobacteria bacterium]|nr:EAL domain-containing protein [Campylobacterota bacterium]